jgi:ABC-type sugar transport system permease subunit
MTVSVRGMQVPARRKFFPAGLNSSRMRESTFAYLLIVPVVLVLVAIMIYPTLFSLWMSLHYIDVGTSLWEWVGLENYTFALGNADLRSSIVRTILYTIYVTSFSSVLAIGGALLLNEQFKGRKYLAALVILPWSVSTYAAAAVFRYMYNPQFGFFNSVLMNLGIVTPQTAIQFVDEKFVLVSIAVAHAWQFSPLGMYFILAVMQVIPHDLYKVAKTDRLGVVGRFVHVTWPYIRLPVLIYLVLVTAEAAKVFDIIYFISGGGPGKSSHDLVYQIYVESFVNWQFGYGAAVSWILVVLIMGITTLYFVTIMRRESQAKSLHLKEAEIVLKERGLGVAAATAADTRSDSDV